MLGQSRVGLFLLQLSSKVQDLMHNDQQVVTAPLRVSCDKLSHDLIYLFYDIHSEELLKLDFSRSDDSADDLQRSSVEFGMANLEILEQDLNEAQLLENEHEGWISLYNYRE